MSRSSLGFVTTVKLSVYQTIAETGRVPDAAQVAQSMNQPVPAIEAAFQDLAGQRLLVLEPGTTGRIRMAPPFSGVETQHKVLAGGITYHANCAWDAFGISAALHKAAEIVSICADCDQKLTHWVVADGPVTQEGNPSEGVVHFAIPAAHWWKDIIYT